MKRLWVRPGGRGLGIGRALAQSVLDRAVAAGCPAIYLDTVPAVMATAHRLYLELGFTPCAPYNQNPIEGIVYLIKRLKTAGSKVSGPDTRISAFSSATEEPGLQSPLPCVNSYVNNLLVAGERVNSRKAIQTLAEPEDRSLGI